MFKLRQQRCIIHGREFDINYFNPNNYGAIVDMGDPNTNFLPVSTSIAAKNFF